ncbi:polyphosphate kinase 2 family protein [Edaphobacter bradus]|uniref:polyphosphate kinase 2 family protein n=1 Tax=Edaphobacter bradus TaxID=2259016 RepID=UPI0021DFCE38|nr:polyphosphate kinase 2 family protein [Edaphobacter bradus]
MKLKSPHLIKPGTQVRLSRIATSSTGAFQSPEAAAPVLDSHRKQLADLQEVLYAGQRKAILIVLQGMDTAGKDGTISHIFSGVNPQGCDVSAFKAPTPIESRHDFLWRVHSQLPPRGMIQIFNRSHYEDVLVSRVHKLLPQKTIDKRLDDINRFEQALYDNDIVILKFFLHISRAEQTARLKSRIADSDKHWKLSESDFIERRFWPRYEQAYNDAIAATSKKHAPWFVIPSDHKWYRNIAVSQIIVDAMKSLKLTYPKPSMDPTKVHL